MIGRRLRVQISDGRVIVGEFECLDKDGNILVDRAREYWIASGETNRQTGDELSLTSENGRRIGYVMIPGPHVVKCEVQST